MNFYKKRRLIILLICILLLILFIWTYKPLNDLLYHPETIHIFINKFGLFSSLVFILIMILQGIFSFIPFFIFVTLGGAFFGFKLGSIYGLIGAMIGASITFLFAKKIGKPLEKKWISKSEIKYFNNLFKQHGDYMAFMGRIISPLPTNVLSFTAGITKMKFFRYFIITLLGFIPFVLIFSYIGAKIIQGVFNGWILSFFIILGICFISMIKFEYHHKIYAILNKLLFSFSNLFFKSDI